MCKHVGLKKITEQKANTSDQKQSGPGAADKKQSGSKTMDKRQKCWAKSKSVRQKAKLLAKKQLRTKSKCRIKSKYCQTANVGYKGPY